MNCASIKAYSFFVTIQVGVILAKKTLSPSYFRYFFSRSAAMPQKISVI